MNGLVRKMCILKELKKGFSADGSPLGGVARTETFAGQVTLQISLINFAPLSEGRYFCVLCDKGGERLIFPLSPGQNEYRAENRAFDAEKGFCCLVCFVLSGKAECLAGGQYGGGSYSLKLLLNGLQDEQSMPAANAPEQPEVPPVPEKKAVYEYDDEQLSERNYYLESGTADSAAEDERTDDQTAQTADRQAGKADENACAGGASALFAPADGESYYLTIKDELERLFAAGKRTDVLESALPNSEWVEMKDAHGCLVGQIYENLQVRYIAYALPARARELPDGMEKACYIPVDPVHPTKGYYVLFQSAATGECVEVKKA